MKNTAPILRLEPSKSDRMVADATCRTLKAKLTRYISEDNTDALLAGRAPNVEINPAHKDALLALMPEVARFVRGGAAAPTRQAA